jgi:rSAM/selenodomain-associated transferase 1
MPADSLFIQFAREPVAGAVKTRMLPYLSPAQACELHQELVLWTCGRLLEAALGPVEIAVAGETGHALFQRCGEMGASRISQQQGSDLGERMYHAIAEGLARYRSVVLVGSDCPAIDGDYLRQALAALEDAPLVFGPAEDGGYVLVAARTVSPEVFRDISWGTQRVYNQTCDRLRRAGLVWGELPTLADIDRPADLARWQALRG